MTPPPSLQNNLLETIVRKKRAEVSHKRTQIPLNFLRARAEEAEPPRRFLSIFSSGFACIAEIKKMSPLRGILSEEFDPAEIARQYERGGAAAISVLTDAEFFGGLPEHLSAVKESTFLPVLRKEFIIDEYQLFESRFYGADAVLLICEILNDDELQKFISLSQELGMAAVVESHTSEGVEKALQAGAQCVGVNNRDLQTFELDLETSFRLKPLIPETVIAISESGIKSPFELIRLQEAGYHGILVGESLLVQKNRAEAVRRFLEPLKTS